MVGFVLIIVIVAIIALVFLAISLNKPSTDNAKKSGEIDRYILSVKDFTSSCAINFEPAYSNIQELVRDCDSEAQCVNGRLACEVLKEDIKNITKISWPLEGDRPYKGWEIGFIGLQSNMTIKEGNITKNYLVGSQPLLPGKRLEFKVYY